MDQNPLPYLSLREKIVAAGIKDEPTIRAHLKRAADVIRLVPGIDIKTFNPLRPMENIHEG